VGGAAPDRAMLLMKERMSMIAGVPSLRQLGLAVTGRKAQLANDLNDSDWLDWP
jgi:hypothetical protein